MVDIECSVAAPCPNISFTNFDISPPNGTAPSFVCINAVNVTGLSGKWFAGFVPMATYERLMGTVVNRPLQCDRTRIGDDTPVRGARDVGG